MSREDTVMLKRYRQLTWFWTRPCSHTSNSTITQVWVFCICQFRSSLT